MEHPELPGMQDSVAQKPEEVARPAGLYRCVRELVPCEASILATDRHQRPSMQALFASCRDTASAAYSATTDDVNRPGLPHDSERHIGCQLNCRSARHIGYVIAIWIVRDCRPIRGVHVRSEAEATLPHTPRRVTGSFIQYCNRCP